MLSMQTCIWKSQGDTILACSAGARNEIGQSLPSSAACAEAILAHVRRCPGCSDFNLRGIDFNLTSSFAISRFEASLLAGLPWVKH